MVGPGGKRLEDGWLPYFFNLFLQQKDADFGQRFAPSLPNVGGGDSPRQALADGVGRWCGLQSSAEERRMLCG